jgi:hypothetical protein
MDRIQTEMVESERKTPEAPQSAPMAVARQGYRRPRIVTIGTASELVQQNSTGGQPDGSGGWWVWGS